MALEGGVAIVAGIVAGSVALIGFGLDSAIEGFASVVIVWRFTVSRTLSHRAEERAQKLVAIQFFILAPYIAVECIRALVDGSHAETSIVGIALAASSGSSASIVSPSPAQPCRQRRSDGPPAGEEGHLSAGCVPRAGVRPPP